jgi:hypothetical protein
MSHPSCDPVHICQKPSGRICIESGCELDAGTLWGPYWCPEHDRERLDRVSAEFEALMYVEDNDD